MKKHIARIVGYIIYFVCLYVLFSVMTKQGLIIRNPKFTLLIAAAISLIISELAEKGIKILAEKRKPKAD